MQVEVEVAGEREDQVELQCRAAKDTWSHQRRKRRILERVKRELEQRSSTMQAETGACMIWPVQLLTLITLQLHA